MPLTSSGLLAAIQLQQPSRGFFVPKPGSGFPQTPDDTHAVSLSKPKPLSNRRGRLPASTSSWRQGSDAYSHVAHPGSGRRALQAMLKHMHAETCVPPSSIATSLSQLPEARNFPFALKATVSTTSLCSVSVCLSAPVSTSQPASPRLTRPWRQNSGKPASGRHLANEGQHSPLRVRCKRTAPNCSGFHHPCAGGQPCPRRFLNPRKKLPAPFRKEETLEFQERIYPLMWSGPETGGG